MNTSSLTRKLYLSFNPIKLLLSLKVERPAHFLCGVPRLCCRLLPRPQLGGVTPGACLPADVYVDCEGGTAESEGLAVGQGVWLTLTLSLGRYIVS